MSFGLSYSDSRAGMDSIRFTEISQEAADNLPHEDYDFSEVHTYSDMDLSRIEFSGNLDVAVSKNLGLTFGLLYDDYTDDDPYLVDGTGTYTWLWAGLRFSF